MWQLAAAGFLVGACGSGGSPVDAAQLPLYMMTWTVVNGQDPALCPAGAIVNVVFTIGDTRAGGFQARCTLGSLSLGDIDLGPHCECGLSAALNIPLPTPQELTVYGVFATHTPEQDGVVTVPVVFNLAMTATRD